MDRGRVELMAHGDWLVSLPRAPRAEVVRVQWDSNDGLEVILTCCCSEAEANESMGVMMCAHISMALQAMEASGVSTVLNLKARWRRRWEM